MSVPAHSTPSHRANSDAAQVPAIMKAVTSRRYGDTRVLTIESLPTPSPGAGKLLVRVLASSTNALDWHFMSGTPLMIRLMMGLRRPKRIIHGADVAGIVEAIGSGVDGFSVGDTIFGESGGGAFAEYVSVDAGAVIVLPPDVHPEAAGATPIAGLTALQGLRKHGAVRSGDRVLINGAAGGVGTFAIQIARALGASEITAVCSAKNAEQARALGATQTIDYHSKDFIAAGGTYDVVLDMKGNRTAAQLRSILTPGARYVAIGGPMTNRVLGPLPQLFRLRLGLRGADASFHQFVAASNPEDLTYLAELLASGKLVPAVERVVGLDGVAGAIDQIASGHGPGKVVIVPSPKLSAPSDTE